MHHSGPTTHISSLANLHKAFCIQMVKPWHLLAALDRSTDLRHDLGDSMQEHFMELLRRKYEDCTEWYITNLATLGIQEPLVIIVRSDGLWQMDEGHHRLAWSLWNNVPAIPVIFDDSGADEDSHMGYLVSRVNVEAYHTTIAADLELVDEVESAFDGDDTPTGEFMVLSAKKVKGGDYVFVPTPRPTNTHAIGGRHRAKK